MNRTKRGPTRPWSKRLQAEAERLEALSDLWVVGGNPKLDLTLHAANQLAEAARHVRVAAEHQAKRERAR